MGGQTLQQPAPGASVTPVPQTVCDTVSQTVCDTVSQTVCGTETLGERRRVRRRFAPSSTSCRFSRSLV